MAVVVQCLLYGRNFLDRWGTRPGHRMGMKRERINCCSQSTDQGKLKRQWARDLDRKCATQRVRRNNEVLCRVALCVFASCAGKEENGEREGGGDNFWTKRLCPLSEGLERRKRSQNTKNSEMKERHARDES